MQKWEGVIPAIVTPLTDDGKNIELSVIREYCDFMVERGVMGIFCCGTTGEGPLLSISERKRVAEEVVLNVNKRIKVVVNAGCITTEDSVELTLHCRDIGADAAAVVLPYYYPLDDQALFNHFMFLVENVPDYPIFVYNIPQCTCNNLSTSLFQKLIKSLPSLVGVKTSNPDPFQIQEYIRIAGDGCSIFVGCDGLVLSALAMGAAGLVSGNASAYPEPFIDIYNAFINGDLEKARQYQLMIDRLRAVLGDGSLIALFKEALKFRGISAGKVRRPNRELSPEEVETLRRSLTSLGLI